jgi:dolichol kinase
MKRTAEVKANQFFDGVSIRLHFRNDLHLARKLWHMLMGLLIAFIYLSGMSQSMGTLILAAFLSLDLFMERSRLRNPALNEKIVRLWGPIMRNHETSRMSTIPHYLAASLIAVGIFPKPVAVLSILYLACGDPIASLFGILYGHKGPKLPGGKTWIGTMAGVVTCALVTIIYLNSLAFAPSSVLILAVIGGLAGGMAELLPFDIDDNFTIPVISGFVLWLAFILMGL